MAILQYLQGRCRLCITGASPQEFLNTLAKERIPFWDICRRDELNYCITIHSKYEKHVKELAVKCFCGVERLWIKGIAQDWKKAKKRPVLVLGLSFVLFLSFFLQSYIWVIEVDGCETVEDEEVLRALQELDVAVGTRADSIDTQSLRHKLLNLLPELSWVAVNRTGGRLLILACARQEQETNKLPYTAANIVSVRDGVITEVNISEGMRLCKVGETVKAGQVLVSGFEDYGLCMKSVCAEAEIYGQTWYTGTLVTPSTTMKKSYTGRTWTQRTLIIGRKRINLSGNSRISGILCDKMIDTAQFTLPGYTFPISLETATYREYELTPVAVSKNEAEQTLLQAWQRSLLSGMIAGKIEQTEMTCIESGGLYVLRVQSTCNELLSRLLPMQVIYGGESE